MFACCANLKFLNDYRPPRLLIIRTTTGCRALASKRQYASIRQGNYIMSDHNDNTPNDPSDNKKDKTNSNDINIQKYDFTAFEKEPLPFTQICNKVIQNITNIQAGFIWIYLQSMPPKWKANKFHLMSHFGISERTYRRLMGFLVECNLVSYERNRNSDGTLGSCRLIVHNGSNFSVPLGDNHTAKIVTVDFSQKPDPERVLDHTAKIGNVDSNHTAKKPQCGDLAPFINKQTSINKTIHTQGDEFFLEKTLYLDSEQQRKAIVMRNLCLNDEKAKTKHASLNTDKTFSEVIDECVSHYATQQTPQLVSPQRLQSWLNREARFKTTSNSNQTTKTSDTKPIDPEITLKLQYQEFVGRIKADMNLNLKPKNTVIPTFEQWNAADDE